jgi:hypothetical protein
MPTRVATAAICPNQLRSEVRNTGIPAHDVCLSVGRQTPERIRSIRIRRSLPSRSRGRWRWRSPLLLPAALSLRLPAPACSCSLLPAQVGQTTDQTGGGGVRRRVRRRPARAAPGRHHRHRFEEQAERKRSASGASGDAEEVCVRGSGAGRGGLERVEAGNTSEGRVATRDAGPVLRQSLVRLAI